MKGFLSLVFVMLVSVASTGQAKTHRTAVQPSHRLQVLSRLNLVQVQFKVSCATTANHASNERCSDEMLRKLQEEYPKLTLQEVPVPKKVQTGEVVFVFNQEAEMFTETLTLTVYETENNDEVYSDSRSVLILNNDMTKLIGNYVEYLGSLDSESAK